MFLLKSKIWLGLVVGLSPSICAYAEEDAEVRAGQLLQQIQQALAVSVSGRMDFTTSYIKTSNDPLFPTSQRTLAGTIFWDYPKVRILFRDFRTGRELSSETPSTIILDTPTEVIEYSPSRQTVYRCPDRSRSYLDSLKVAPWQSWFKLFGQVEIEKLLAFETYLQEFPGTLISVQGNSLAYTGKESTFYLHFDPVSNMITEYGAETSSRSITWQELDGRYFPAEIRYAVRRSSTPVEITFSGFAARSGLKDVDYTMDSLLPDYRLIES